MKPLDRKTAAKLDRLGDALDARTAGAAQAYQAAMEAVENIDRQIVALRVLVARTAGELDPNDLASYAAYEPWAEQQRQKIKDLVHARVGAEARAEALREELSRAYGEEQAVTWLLDASKKALRARARAEERNGPKGT